MTPLRHLWWVPLVSILILRSSAEAVTLVWPDGKHGQIAELEKQWFEWETEFSVFPKQARLRVEMEPLSNNEVAHAKGTTLFLSSLALNEWSVRSHELAHAFLNVYCPEFRREKFLSEAFAYQISGDYSRWLKNGGALYASTSLTYLTDNRSRLNELEDLVPALTRLLAEDPAQDWRQFWKEFFKDCEKGQMAHWREKVLTNLSLPPPVAAGEEGLVILDKISGLPILKKGKVVDFKPVGSLLKPLLISVSSRLRLPRGWRSDPTWACEKPHVAKPRLWSWPDALVHSCNGFFIDAEIPKADLEQATNKLNQITGRDFSGLRTEQLIGLVPGAELSALEIARLYRELSRTQPEILKALLETSKTGTLSELPDSNWFTKNNIALKSGTKRDSKNRPVMGWIAASTPAWVAIYYKMGRSPSEILGNLRWHLKDFAQLQPTPTEVQVLGLVPDSQIELRCSERDSPKLASDLREGESFICPQSRILATFPLKDGTPTVRAYYGEILKSSVPIKLFEKTTLRRSRARAGSSLILKTSRLSYTLEVVASEFPNGRLETLKVLAVAVQSNSSANRHTGRPSCDTTHCQVYQNNWETLSSPTQERILEAVLAIEHAKPVGRGWMNFAIGGSVPWRQVRNLKITKELLTDQEFKRLGTEELASDCERIRNQLRLPSCPEKISFESEKIIFEGQGEGHGLGIDLKRTDSLAAQGYTYIEILDRQ